MLFAKSGFEELCQYMLTMVVPTVVANVFTDKLFGLTGLVLEQIWRLLQDPLTVAPSVVVAGTLVGASFAQRQFDRPVYRLAA